LRPELPKGRKSRPKAESGVEFLGGDSEPSPRQLGGLGSAVSYSSGIRDTVPAAKEFGAF